LTELKMGKTIMIVAHANSLRGIVKEIDGLSNEDIQKVGIPNGIPLIYKFDKSMKPIPQPKAVLPCSGEFLGKKVLISSADCRHRPRVYFFLCQCISTVSRWAKYTCLVK
jgi:hypothetical protein